MSPSTRGVVLVLLIRVHAVNEAFIEVLLHLGIFPDWLIRSCCYFFLEGCIFGNITAAKHNFLPVVFVIILLSVLPGIIEIFRHQNQPFDSPV